MIQPAFHTVDDSNASIALGEGLESSASVRPATVPSTTTTTTTPRGARAV